MNNAPHQCNAVMPMPLTRRDVLKTVSAGFGWLALQGLAGHADAAASTATLAARPTPQGAAAYLHRASSLWLTRTHPTAGR